MSSWLILVDRNNSSNNYGNALTHNPYSSALSSYAPVLLFRIDSYNIPIPTIVTILLYMAIVLIFLQELLKLVGIRGRAVDYALWLGVGFGLGEIALVILNQILSVVASVGFI